MPGGEAARLVGRPPDRTRRWAPAALRAQREIVGSTWRDLRVELTPALLTRRLEEYLAGLFDRYS
ncbi:hypothetical protein [Streptomyces sp. 8K308]|uniref:hypothetical protein n=1 Tax=Streptomyces sp. 8K308 TaxID=2530388 RepID=UPI001FB7C353|nr:hypothetical protein [Streptomyces sp. 8K308]